MRHRESPIKRRNPSGEIVWVARFTGRDGKRKVAKPTGTAAKARLPKSRKPSRR